MILKAMLTLVCWNFYLGSQISTLENTFTSMMLKNHDGDDRDRSDAEQSPLKLANSTAGMDRPMASVHDAVGDDAGIKRQQVGMIVPSITNGKLQGKERLWNILQTRNVTEVDATYWASVPTWDSILQNLHTKHDGGDNTTNKPASPIIYGLETCQSFRDITSSNPSQRRVAPAGLFNTGTNYLSVLLDYNCQNPHRVKQFHGNAKRGHGNEWEVLWGKHSPANSRGKYYKNDKAKYTVDELLPIVLIRNPFGWMKSMCRNPYAAKWKGMGDIKSCPRLKDGDDWNTVNVNFGPGSTHHLSLAHFYNDWYGEYFYNKANDTGINSGNSNSNTAFPRLIVRFEDLIFFPYEVTKTICECAGGVLGHREEDKDVTKGSFHYVVRSAKAGSGHGPASQRNGLIDSWIKYGSIDPKGEYSAEDVKLAEEVLDPFITNEMGYIG